MRWQPYCAMNAHHTPSYWWRADRVMKPISVWGWLGGHDGRRPMGDFGQDAGGTPLLFEGHPGIWMTTESQDFKYIFSSGIEFRLCVCVCPFRKLQWQKRFTGTNGKRLGWCFVKKIKKINTIHVNWDIAYTSKGCGSAPQSPLLWYPNVDCRASYTYYFWGGIGGVCVFYLFFFFFRLFEIFPVIKP